MRPVRVLPSLLSADFARLADEVREHFNDADAASGAPPSPPPGPG